MTAAEERIEALIKRAGSPVMIVKGDGQYSASARMAQIDKQARMMAHELHSPKYECTISIMGDEIIAQDAKIRDMANTIDRLETALSNVINEREQLKRDLHSAATVDGLSCGCRFCAHENKGFDEEPCKTCVALEGCQCFEWRGIPEEADAHE